MLTVPSAQIDPETTYWVIQFDLEEGHSSVDHAGPGHVSNMDYGLEFHDTGFSSRYSQTWDQGACTVEIWGDDYVYMAIFPDEASMKDGAVVIMSQLGNDLPLGVYRALSAL